MADKTTGELDPVKESPIGDLPGVLEVYDDSLIPIEQLGQAHKMTGRQFRQFGEKSAEKYVQTAVDAADKALTYKDDAQKSAEHAEQYSGKPPIVQNNTWWVWNAYEQQYIDTGETAVGNIMYATFMIDPYTGVLYMYTDSKYEGPQFRLNGPDLEVVLFAEP